MIDKNIHEMLADGFHSTNDVVVKRQIFLALHNFMISMIPAHFILFLAYVYFFFLSFFFFYIIFVVKNSEKAMHTKVIKILVETLQMPDDVIDPGTTPSLLLFLFLLLSCSFRILTLQQISGLLLYESCHTYR